MKFSIFYFYFLLLILLIDEGLYFRQFVFEGKIPTRLKSLNLKVYK